MQSPKLPLMRIIITYLTIFLTVFFLSVGNASAQAGGTSFPSKPVRIIVPQTPGGASDALARIVGQKLY
jgi:tripartite-type tricarboxylate transporter receptor subunit TctC